MRKTLTCKNCKQETNRYDEQIEWNDIRCPHCGYTSDDSNVQGWAVITFSTFDRDIADTPTEILESMAREIEEEELIFLMENFDEFVDKMRERLIEKHNQGFTGWDEEENLEKITWEVFDRSNEIVKQVFSERDLWDKEFADLCNFIFMVHYLTLVK